MSPPVWLTIACAVVIGWLLSGTWRGTTRRGYLLALDHVEMMARTRSLDDALRTLRKEAK